MTEPSDERRDIEDRADCERLVRAFYGRALADPFIGWIFTDVAHLDLESHVPRITSFWETILLGAQSYGGGAFHPHATLHAKVELRAGHFDRWLALWTTTVDELFAGERAEQAKAHAHRVGRAFHRRLNGLPPDFLSIRPREPAGDGLAVTQHGPPSVLDLPE
ncbi:group III truncated hemoglobin [Patulibacter defluvii]|uniref:group III truncated hemoglobin n=1 Tax=Patulibacter defluvii TaxID=3095358 RepID=UPI002A74BBFC|nr:group III truncated hemoglobin [Patulibacter sp. DM4]